MDLAALGTLGALQLVLARRFAFRIDDAFISFRYARNWADGAGLCFHPGADPPVEGFSNFLWVAGLALSRALGFSDLPAVADLASQTAALTIVLGLYLALRTLLTLRPRAAFLGAALAATATPLAVYSTSGLETAAFALVFALTTFLGSEAARSRRPGVALAAGLCALALALLRVEGLLWALALAVLAALSARLESSGARVPSPNDGRPLAPALLAWALPLALGYGAFLAFRHATFDAWVANTVYAKAGLSSSSLLRGAKTSASFLLSFPAPLLVLFGTPFALRAERDPRRRSWLFSALGASLGLVLYNTLVGGDWMPFFRFLVPLWVLVAVLAALLLERLPRGLAWAAGGALCALGIAPGLGWLPTPTAWRAALAFRSFEGGYESELARWRKATQNGERFTEIGRALAEVADPGDSLAIGAIGAIGYYSDLRIHDRNGLVDREVARRELDDAQHTGTAGHDKRVPWSWFADRQPTFYEATIYDPSQAPLRAAARAFAGRIFARDPELARCCVAESFPLTPGQGGAPRALLVLRHEPDPALAAAYWRP